tara:strand:- start:580 stop:1254 length:675 start_codon:yes stop_codon:yes gene_type:complete
MTKKTKEPQYQDLINIRSNIGLAKLGLMTNQIWHDDPRRLSFVLARYKFVSKMLSGKEAVLEVGCGDSFGSRIVLQEVKSLVAIDFDPILVNDVNKRMTDKWEYKCLEHDIISGPVIGKFDSAFSLDVLEHISPENENKFIKNISKSLDSKGVLVIGTPSIYSQKFASKQSLEGHINCKNAEQLRELMSNHFKNVFIFSMNDEVVHTGFYPMAHYYFALACRPK